MWSAVLHYPLQDKMSNCVCGVWLFGFNVCFLPLTFSSGTLDKLPTCFLHMYVWFPVLYPLLLCYPWNKVLVLNQLRFFLNPAGGFTRDRTHTTKLRTGSTWKATGTGITLSCLTFTKCKNTHRYMRGFPSPPLDFLCCAGDCTASISNNITELV